jgi:ubiquinone/menaquinone biosynthesis C-methylase UbiE
MAHAVCPWWLGYFLVTPLRRLAQDPRAILRPFVAQGMTVLEPGPGMGFFTLEMARLAGPRGRVVAIDVQPKMLAALRRRAKRAGLLERIEAREAAIGRLGTDDLAAQVDFALAFAVVHELPDVAGFLAEVYQALKVGGQLLVVEPSQHVSAAAFADTIATAERAGFTVAARPAIRWSQAVLLARR